MEDSRVCVIHFCLEKAGKKKRKNSEGGRRESENHASSFSMRVLGEATGFMGRLLLLLSSVLKRAEINSWVQ
jgi:hypothetical protein